tara:strand:+ start:492 stop:686 length:195 start_codon:yes stop_codon:yes gene_type:complete
MKKSSTYISHFGLTENAITFVKKTAAKMDITESLVVEAAIRLAMKHTPSQITQDGDSSTTVMEG